MEVASPPDLGPPPCLIPRLEETVGRRKVAFWMAVKEVYLTCTTKLVEHFADVANDNTDFEPNVAYYLPLLTPKLTKAGKVAARQPVIPKKKLKWWRAQCLFRDLPITGTIADLQARLREHGAKTTMSAKMAELRDRMRREWSEKNAQKLEEEWRSSDDSRKAELWPKRFLFEKFMAETPDGRRRKEDVIVVRVTDWANAMEKAAPEMGIAIETRGIPESMYPGGVYKPGLRDVVLGVDEQAVRARAAELSREYEQICRKEAQEKAEKKRKRQEELEREYSRAKQQQQAGKQSGYWDVEGTWSISCPYIEEYWGRDDGNDECTLEIHVADDGKKSVQMYALFEFIVLTGIMRFLNPKVDYNPDDEKKKKINNDDYDYDDDDDDDDDDSDVDGGETPAHFLLSETQLPSSKNRKFSYCWRGEETGEGEIQLDSDKALYSLEFTSPNTLRGTIASDYFRTVEFRGFKEKSLKDTDQVGQKRKRRGGAHIANEEWRSRSESEYNRAAVARWGGWGR